MSTKRQRFSGRSVSTEQALEEGAFSIVPELVPAHSFAK
jgi:hypothetical protein